MPVIVFSLYVGALLPGQAVQALQWQASDRLMGLRAAFARRDPRLSPFLLVAVDDESLRRVPQRWPWDRRRLATAIDRLREAHPRLICLDLIPVGETTPESDQALAEAMRRAGNVVLPTYVNEQGERVESLPIFQQAAVAAGFVNKPPDADLRIRDARMAQLSPLLEPVGYSFEVNAAATLLQASPQFRDGTLRFVDAQGRTIRTVPLRVDGVMPIAYTLREFDMPVVPIYQLLQQELPAELVRDKIVLIGNTARILHERYPTPLGTQPGVIILGNTLLTLLQGRVPVEIPIGLQWFLILAGAVAAAAGIYRLAPLRGVLVGVGLAAAFVASSVLVYWQSYTWDFVGFPLVVAAVVGIGLTHRSVRLGIEAARLRLLATTDSLTGVANIGYLQVRLQHELVRVRRYGTPLAVVMFDVDDFKSINDRYGHLCGNDLIKGLVDCVRRETRLADLIARYGGDEFCVVLFQTGPAEALTYAEHIRGLVLSRGIPTRIGPLRVTLSLGVAAVPPGMDVSAERLLEQADMALYRSKQSGKNMVSAYEPTANRSPLTTPS